MMQMMLTLGGLEVDPNEKKVLDGKQKYQSIFELENKFENSGQKQGAKFTPKQRMQTVGY